MKLKDYLHKNKITQAEFAKKLGISRSMLSHYFTHRHRVPMPLKLAVEYITGGEVKRDDWN